MTMDEGRVNEISVGDERPALFSAAAHQVPLSPQSRFLREDTVCCVTTDSFFSSPDN